MRKGRDGEKKKKKRKENNGGNSGHYVVASRPPKGDRLQRRRSCQLMYITTLQLFLAITPLATFSSSSYLHVPLS